MNKLQIVEVTCRPSSLRRWVIRQGQKDIGLIEKFKDDRYTKNPWKAFFGIGWVTKMIGAFYGKSGRQDAINAVLKHAEVA